MNWLVGMLLAVQKVNLTYNSRSWVLLLKWDQNTFELNTVLSSYAVFSLDQGSKGNAENKTWEERTLFSSTLISLTILNPESCCSSEIKISLSSTWSSLFTFFFFSEQGSRQLSENKTWKRGSRWAQRDFDLTLLVQKVNLAYNIRELKPYT